MMAFEKQEGTEMEFGGRLTMLYALRKLRLETKGIQRPTSQFLVAIFWLPFSKEP